MKGIFCIDLSKDKHNTEIDGLEFAVENVPEYQEEAIDNNAEALEDVVESASLPKSLRILEFFFELGALFAAYIVLEVLFDDMTFKQIYANAPFIFCFSLVSLIGFPILWLMRRKKSKEVSESDDTVSKINRAQSLTDASYEMLGVPHDAVDADVLMIRYKLKNGEIKPTTGGTFSMFESINLSSMLFADEKNLYIADTATKYAFPFAEMRGIRRINKQLTFHGWNKETEFDKGEYKQYKIKANQYGVYFIKPYYALQISRNGEDYELYFPPYELNVFENLTGLTATE